MSKQTLTSKKTTKQQPPQIQKNDKVIELKNPQTQKKNQK